MYRGMYTYAWDLAEEGVAAVAGRLADAGLNAVTLATSYHAGKFLRPHAPRRKVYFPEDGTVYFQPDMARYGRIKPRVNSMVAGFDALAELERAAPALDRVGWTVCLHNTPLGQAHPDLVARNAFGDPYIFSLCPSQPAAREYVVALCADMGANYSLKALALETPGWLPFAHGYHHEFQLVEMNPWVEAMLGLCFCDACREGARGQNFDFERLRLKVRADVERFLAADIAPAAEVAAAWWTADIATDPEWAAFLAWRCGVVAGLVREVRAALNPAVELRIVPTVQSPNALCWSEGSDLALLAAEADVLEVPAYQTGVAAIAADAWDVRRRVGDAARLNFILRPSYPNLRDANALSGAVGALRALSAEGFGFYNYGHVRLQSLDWIRTALTGH